MLHYCICYHNHEAVALVRMDTTGYAEDTRPMPAGFPYTKRRSNDIERLWHETECVFLGRRGGDPWVDFFSIDPVTEAEYLTHVAFQTMPVYHVHSRRGMPDDVTIVQQTWHE